MVLVNAHFFVHQTRTRHFSKLNRVHGAEVLKQYKKT